MLRTMRMREGRVRLRTEVGYEADHTSNRYWAAKFLLNDIKIVGETSRNKQVGREISIF
jgi:hypothetical protein